MFTVVFEPLTTTALTAQFVESGSLSFDTPAGTTVRCDEVPQESVTFAGAVSCVTAQR